LWHTVWDWAHWVAAGGIGGCGGSGSQDGGAGDDVSSLEHIDRVVISTECRNTVEDLVDSDSSTDLLGRVVSGKDTSGIIGSGSSSWDGVDHTVVLNVSGFHACGSGGLSFNNTNLAVLSSLHHLVDGNGLSGS